MEFGYWIKPAEERELRDKLGLKWDENTKIVTVPVVFTFHSTEGHSKISVDVKV